MRNVWAYTATLIDEYKHYLLSDYRLSSEIMNTQLILIDDFESTIFHYFNYNAAGIFEAARSLDETEAMRLLIESTAVFASANEALDNVRFVANVSIQVIGDELANQSNSSIIIIVVITIMSFIIIVGLGIAILILNNARKPRKEINDTFLQSKSH